MNSKEDFTLWSSHANCYADAGNCMETNNAFGWAIPRFMAGKGGASEEKEDVYIEALITGVLADSASSNPVVDIDPPNRDLGQMPEPGDGHYLIALIAKVNCSGIAGESIIRVRLMSSNVFYHAGQTFHSETIFGNCHSQDTLH